MRGVWTALITPFTPNREIDWAAFKTLLEDQESAQVAGVIPCGTTGESPTLSLAEKKQLIEFTKKELVGTSVQIVAGTGSNDTAESIALSAWASSLGVDGILVVTPYYNKPSQSGLELHYRAIADKVSCPVVLYNVPGRTGVSLAPETVTRLASHPNIRAIKEATGNTAISSEIIEQLAFAGVKMDVLSGDDATYLPLLSAGGCGVISVASNLFPRAMVALQRAWETGNVSAAMEIHRRFYPLFRDLFVESNPGPIKAAMKFVGLCDSGLRPPLAPLSSGSESKLLASLSRCGLQSNGGTL